jgi:hypothetical protein
VIRNAFLDAAESAIGLLRDPAVAASWDKPSALPKWAVSGLAGHLARQVLHVPTLLAATPPPGEPISVLEHYARVDWIDTGTDSPTNTGIRVDAEVDAAGGIADLVERTSTALAGLATTIPRESADRIVHLPWGPWSLSLDDFLTTRLLEIAIHSDDLAISVAIPTPELPGAAIDPVLQLLLELSVRRHGPTTVLRGLSRSERATGISAF